jgi:hypothetical protein
MRALFNGRLFDTDKAKKLGSWNNHFSHNNPNWCQQILYKTETGTYFLQLCVNTGRCEGENIYVMESEQEAFEWAQEKLDPDSVITHFSSFVEEG